MIDVYLSVLAFSLGAGALGIHLAEWRNYAVTFAALLLWIPVEATFLHFLGQTPGKWLFQIRICESHGGYLPFGIALLRTLLIFTKGQGLGIPFITVFTLISSFRRLEKKGTTSWDEELSIMVMHGNIGPFRIFLIAAILFAIIALQIISHFAV